MKKFLFAALTILFFFSASGQGSNEHYLIIGTYTSGKSEGIYVYKFNSVTGESSQVSKIFTSNPSFVTVSPDEKFLYAVNEDQPGGVTAFSFDKMTGTLKVLNKQPSGGDDPCYITTYKTGKWVVAGNYTGGNLSVLPVSKDGSLGTATDIVNHTGSSVNSARQEKPHVHSTVFSKDYKYLYVPDLGIDKVMIYSFDSKNGKLKPAATPEVLVEAGAGPRHFDFHPNGKFAYLMEELTGSISVYYYGKKGSLSLQQNITALPHDYLGSMGSADIHVSPDGKFLYGSNRGESNTIAIFSIDQHTGKLTARGHQSTLGKAPRNFNFDPTGKFLLVANQNSDEIVVFKRDIQTGLLTDTGKRIQVPNPVCLKWINTK
ncbi:MAG: lactonase family protein [Chitinophagaceae bacterium]|nr:MAG: lactonase family protein [Chitinophagaceae bacterium]